MAYTLTIHSISPTTAANTGYVGLTVNYTLSGSGISFPGFQISLYSALTGGTLVKTLYYDEINELPNGLATSVTFSNVSPGTYYIDIFYKVAGSVRKAITITGQSSVVELITLNGIKVTTNTHNGTTVTNETLNGTKLYGS